ncbi:MAG: hypothetical protein IKZ11_03890 [Alistipes sp.]|nr:hypothetical protein [Alistipes sp.]
MASEKDKIFVLQSDVASLMESRRWGDFSAENGDVNSPLSEQAQGLLQSPMLDLKDVDIEQLTKITSSDIVDKFLRTEHHRIVAEDGEVEEEVVTSAELDDEDDLVSEELAEVYLSQGLKDMAKETYRKLSLLNPEKSIYFAEIISKIESNN